MSLLALIIYLVLIGLALWAINTYVPMDAKIKKILNIVVVVAVVLWLLFAFGLLGEVESVRVPRIR